LGFGAGALAPPPPPTPQSPIPNPQSPIPNKLYSKKIIKYYINNFLINKYIIIYNNKIINIYAILKK